MRGADAELDAPGAKLNRLLKEPRLGRARNPILDVRPDVLRLRAERGRGLADSRYVPLLGRGAERAHGGRTASERHGGRAEHAVPVVSGHRFAVGFGQLMRFRDEPVVAPSSTVAEAFIAQSGSGADARSAPASAGRSIPAKTSGSPRGLPATRGRRTARPAASRRTRPGSSAPILSPRARFPKPVSSRLRHGAQDGRSRSPQMRERDGAHFCAAREVWQQQVFQRLVRAGQDHARRAVVLRLDEGRYAAVGGEDLRDFALSRAGGFEAAVLPRRAEAKQSGSRQRLEADGVRTGHLVARAPRSGRVRFRQAASPPPVSSGRPRAPRRRSRRPALRRSRR